MHFDFRAVKSQIWRYTSIRYCPTACNGSMLITLNSPMVLPRSSVNRNCSPSSTPSPASTSISKLADVKCPPELVRPRHEKLFAHHWHLIGLSKEKVGGTGIPLSSMPPTFLRFTSICPFSIIIAVNLYSRKRLRPISLLRPLGRKEQKQKHATPCAQTR